MKRPSATLEGEVEAPGAGRPTEPVGELDIRFSSNEATATEWSAAEHAVVPVKVLAFPKGEPFSQTRFRFDGGPR